MSQMGADQCIEVRSHENVRTVFEWNAHFDR